MNSTRDVVVITGSKGLIGSKLANQLSTWCYVIGCDVGEVSLHRPPCSEEVYLNLGSLENIKLAIKYIRESHHLRIASVILLAAYYDFSGEERPDYEEINIQGTARFLDELRNLMVEQIIYSSTMLVYAPCQPGGLISEDSPLKPMWAHPRSSLQTEKIIEGHHEDTPYVLLRIAGVYDDYCHSLPLAHQIQRIYENRFLGHLFPGHPTHGQAFVHIDDIVDAIVQLVRHRQELPPALTLLIGEPETLSYSEIQHELGRLIHGHEWATHAVPKGFAKAEMLAQTAITGHEDPFFRSWMIDRAEDHYALDITRARTLLSWVPRRSLRETLPKMVAALKADPIRWYREHKLELPSSLSESATQPLDAQSRG